MPKFTIRQLLFATVIFGFLGAILSWAVKGNLAALGFGFAVLGLVIPFGVYGLVYAFVYTFANLIYPVEAARVPFAAPVPPEHHENKTPSSADENVS